MFGLFKRTKVEEWENEMLINIFSQLPEEYFNLKQQIQEGLLSRVRIYNDSRNYVGFSYNPLISKKFEDKLGRYFCLTNIEVFDTIIKKFVKIDIYITHGLIIGYSIPKNSKVKLDVSRVNTAKMSKKYFDNIDFKDIEDILSEDERKIINTNDVFKITIKNKIYYCLKEIDDGNFIGIDTDKNIYEINHSMQSIQRTSSKLIDILSKNE